MYMLKIVFLIILTSIREENTKGMYWSEIISFYISFLLVSFIYCHK